MYNNHIWIDGEVITAAKLNNMEDGILTNAMDMNLASEFSTDNAYTAGQYVIEYGDLYRFVADKAAGEWDSTKVVAVVLCDDVANKANTDGSYADMTVGMAENLVSSVGIDDKTPYNFRTSGGNIDIGDKERVDAIVGVSLPWNQLVQNGNFASDVGWSWRQTGGGGVENNEGKLIAVVTTYNNQMYQDISLPANHKFLVTFSARKGANNSFSELQVSLASSATRNVTKNVALGTTKADYAVIMTYTGASDNLRFALSASSLAVGDTAYISNVNIFDLTQKFGSTIADYIYTLEKGTAGAGVAWFRKYFPKLFYGFSAPTMLSVKTSVHKMTGFNQFDKSKAVNGKRFNTTGITNISSSFSRSDWIRVVPNTTYYFKNVVGYSDMGAIYWYDADKNYLQSHNISGSSPKSGYFTSPANAYYVGVNFRAVDIDSVCVSLRWDGERDGEYEAYQSWNYPLDSDLELRGIPKLDANNKLYYDGDTYAPDGTVTRKYGIVDLGTLTWAKGSGATYFSATIIGIKRSTGWNAVPQGIICPTYTPDTANNVAASTTDMTISVAPNADTFIIYNSAYASSTKDQFKTAMDGVYLVYELATPTTETADPYQQPQNVSDWGTEEYVDERTVPIPVGHNTFYQANLKAKLEMAPDSPSDGDGLYVVQQISGENTYVPLVVPNEIPNAPTTDGTYVLKATVADGTATYSWVSE